jgi:polysaccharide biosynthesis transport protein
VQVVEHPNPMRPPDALPPPSPPDDSGEGRNLWPELLNYLFILRKHVFLFLGVLVVVTAVVSVLGMRQQKVYRAKSTVLVAFNPPKVLKEGNDIYQMSHRVWEYQRYFETQPAVIESREVLQEVVAALSLDADEDFLGVAGMEPGAEKAQAILNKDPVSILRARIDIEPMQESLALSILVRDTNDERAAAIANGVATAYIGYYRNQRSSAMTTASTWLKGRVTELRGDVGVAEDSLMTFQRDHDFLATTVEDTINLSNDRIMRVNEAHTMAELEYLDLKARWDRSQTMDAQGNTEAIPEVLASQTIQELKSQLFDVSAERSGIRARYGEKMSPVKQVDSRHAEIVRSIELETRRLLDGMESELLAKERVLAQLSEQLEQERALAMDLKEREMEFHGLERDLSQTEALYSQTRDRSLEAELAGMLEQSNISVLDRATRPKRPFEPKLRRVLFMAIVLGLSAALIAIFIADRLDAVIRHHEQLEGEFKLPTIGIQPKFEGREEEIKEGTEESPLVVAREPRGTVAESCRTIRTNLMFMTPGRSLRTMVISSAGPSEGKTTLAANLAYTMASSGNRVLLVDTDMRRPRVHKTFGMNKQQGLAAALIGEIPIDEAIRPSGYANLDLLPLGNVPPNPAELLDSSSFGQLVEVLASRYDRVLFDSPPVMAVTDTSILAQYADGLLLVVRQNKTNRHVLRQAIRTLQTVNTNILGFVLNDVDLDAARRGHYMYRYRYQYPYYYYTYRYQSQYHDDDNEDEGKRPEPA